MTDNDTAVISPLISPQSMEKEAIDNRDSGSPNKKTTEYLHHYSTSNANGESKINIDKKSYHHNYHHNINIEDTSPNHRVQSSEIIHKANLIKNGDQNHIKSILESMVHATNHLENSSEIMTKTKSINPTIDSNNFEEMRLHFENTEYAGNTKIQTEVANQDITDEQTSKQHDMQGPEMEVPGSNHTEQAFPSRFSRIMGPKHGIGLDKSIKELAEVIINAASIRQKRAVLQLNPPELGRVKVEISFMHNNELHALFTADHPEAKMIIEAQIQQLRNQLDQKGFTLIQYSVDVGAGQGFAFRQGNGHRLREGFFNAGTYGNNRKQKRRHDVSIENTVTNHAGRINLRI